MDVDSGLTFTFAGEYRVQSRNVWRSSELRGAWFPPGPGLLTAEAVNTVVRASRLSRVEPCVRLRAADVQSRLGTFHDEPDILYKTDFFRPSNQSAPMPCNIVDVRKAVAFAARREEYLVRLFTPEAWAGVKSALTGLQTTVANEYFCHEAGHLFGIDVHTKYTNGYFRLGGRTLWPLVFVEELRADLHGFGIARQALETRLAIKVFLYNLALRFGVEVESRSRRADGYGSVPVLLFSVLSEIGYVSVHDRGHGPQLHFDTCPEAVLDAMDECSHYAGTHVSRFEHDSGDVLECAVHSAELYRALATRTSHVEGVVAAFEHAAHRP